MTKNPPFSYYSLIQVPVSLVTGDKISIGMIYVASDNKFKVEFSEKKIKVAKSLLEKDQWLLLDVKIESIKNAGNSLKENGGEERPDVFSFSYLEYLSRYSNNTLNFQSPVRIISDTDFEYSVFFEKMLGKENVQ